VTDHDTGTDERLVAYLLGRLDADAREDVEVRYLRDEAFHDELQAVELDLIDRYVQGELAGEEAHAFERAYLHSPASRRKVEFARQLMRSLAADGNAASQVDAPAPPAMPTAVTRRTPPRWWWGLAMTTAALLLVTWLGSRLGDERPDTVSDVPQQATSARPQPAEPGPGVEPTPPSAPPSAAPPAGKVVTLVLLPTLTRAAGTPPTLVIDDDTVETELQLVLESAGDYQTYQVTVRAAGAGEVWRREGLTTRRLSAGDAVVVRPPTPRLRADDYLLTVDGVSADGQADAVARYYLRVQRK
jgi:anti-sigma factor RsiW